MSKANEMTSPVDAVGMCDKPRYYKGKWIVGGNGFYRVKRKMSDDYSCHHGHFESVYEAKCFIDSRNN